MNLIALAGQSKWPSFYDAVEYAGLTIDAAGVLAILIGLGVAVFRFLRDLRTGHDAYRRLRQDLGRGILVGLEFLVAADIIRTVAVMPTLEGVAVLGLIVLIRTFLSVALQVELEGRWPWQRPNQESAQHSADVPASYSPAANSNSEASP